MSAWKMIGLPLTAFTAMGLVMGFMSTSTITACSSSNSSSGSSSGGATSATACPGANGAAALVPGQLAPANCLVSTEDGCNATAQCPIDTKTCGSTGSAGSPSCEPFADNSGKTTWDLRMRRITMIAPKALAGAIVQNSIVSLGVDLNLKSCGEVGQGLFNWLLRFDTSTNTLTTGGAPPTSDPIGTGYCFAKRSDLPIPLAPINVPLTKGSDGSYATSQPIPTLNIPIYYLDTAHNTTQIITLPIQQGQIQGLTFSNNGNCVGSINPLALRSDCTWDDQGLSCAKWHTGGSLGGYMTLEQADKVAVPQLNKSLCAFLTGDTAPTVNPATGLPSCERDASGKIKLPGDYCSTSSKPADCADSFWLAATFAASAVKITDGAGVADCTGGGGGDAGADTGAATDASPE